MYDQRGNSESPLIISLVPSFTDVNDSLKIV